MIALACKYSANVRKTRPAAWRFGSPREPDSPRGSLFVPRSPGRPSPTRTPLFVRIGGFLRCSAYGCAAIARITRFAHPRGPCGHSGTRHSDYLPEPVAMPAMNCFWNTMYTMITGIIASEVAANSPP